MAMTTMTHLPGHAARVFGGVDTHKDVHVAAALDELGRLLGTGSFATTTAGYQQLWRWLRSWGEVVAIGVEGTGSWGAGLARHLTAGGVDVREVMRPNRQHRRRYGKSDEADAIGAARAVLAGEAVGTPKAGTGQVEAIRLLRIARRSAMKARTQAGNQIHAVIDTAPEQLRRRFTGRPTDEIVAETALFRRRHAPTTPLEAARLTLRTLARRWEYLDDELNAIDAQLDELTAATAPTLRAINGVGTQVATAVLAAAGDNPERLRSSASFAALCGVSPIDASSGRQQHHRLNRYGDRHANWALHVIIISRLRWHPPTQAYMARRLAEGRTHKMIMRCLKRHVVREVYRAITTDLSLHHEHEGLPRIAAQIQHRFGSACSR
jgi:transposase